MTNSLIYFKKKGQSKITFTNFDCCENLGLGILENGRREMYVGLPIKMMDPFFLDDKENLETYLRFVTECLDIEFRLATNEEVESVDNAGAPEKKEDLIFVKGIMPEKVKITNKHFNSAYNLVRYQWYQRYTPIAIIATNLYRLGYLSPIDTLAIASSFQKDNVRCLLPTKTNELNGILFFREKEAIIKNLQNNMMFNKVFYMYPIYFNPKIVIRGSFFVDAEREIAAKEEIYKLVGVDDISDLPGSARAAFKIITDEYLVMKQVYTNLTAEMEKNGYAMDFGDPLLLSKSISNKKLIVHNAMGSQTYLFINVDREKCSATQSKLELTAEIKGFEKLV